MTPAAATHAIPVSQVESKIAELESEVSRLCAKIEALRSLVDDSPVGMAGDSITPVINEFWMSGRSTAQPGPRAAILNLVTDQPGLTPTEIADALIGKTNSTAKDERNVLRTTVAKLVTDKHLVRDDQNGHYLAGKKEQ